MKTFRKMLSASRRFAIGFLCLWPAAIVVTSCDAVQAPIRPGVQRGENVSIERIHISALTEFVTAPAHPDAVQLKVLLEVFDAFDSPTPMPCILRFELYELRSLSSNPRGKRLLIWPEQDLSNAENAGEHWKNLLRGYEFYLPLDGFTPQRDRKYLLEATCFAGRKRRSDLFRVQFQPPLRP